MKKKGSKRCCVNIIISVVVAALQAVQEVSSSGGPAPYGTDTISTISTLHLQLHTVYSSFLFKTQSPPDFLLCDAMSVLCACIIQIKYSAVAAGYGGNTDRYI